MIIYWKNSRSAQLNYYKGGVWVWNIETPISSSLKDYYTGGISLAKRLRRGLGF